MANLEITMSLLGRQSSPGTPELLSGEVPIKGAVAHAKREKDTDATTAAMLALRYDVGEMSIGSYTHARDQGIPLKALPIFFARMFPHRGVFVSPTAGIKQPSDLRGKRVGVRQFWMSASIWNRLVMQQEYGIDMRDINWVTCQAERLDTLQLPPNAKRSPRGVNNPRELFEAGDVDAVTVPGGGGPEGTMALFPNAVAAQVDYYKRTGVYPTHHIVAINEDLARREPWLVENLCDAFQTAKEMSRKKAQKGLADPSEFPGEPIVGLSPEETEKLFGPDPLPYGITRNQKTLEAFLDGAYAQGLTKRRLTIDEFFVPKVPAKFR